MGFTVKDQIFKKIMLSIDLENLKIKIFIGHDSKNINKNDIIIFSNAIPNNNVELKYA